jgi:hypothetical protein
MSNSISNAIVNKLIPVTENMSPGSERRFSFHGDMFNPDRDLLMIDSFQLKQELLVLQRPSCLLD